MSSEVAEKRDQPPSVDPPPAKIDIGSPRVLDIGGPPPPTPPTAVTTDDSVPKRLSGAFPGSNKVIVITVNTSIVN